MTANPSTTATPLLWLCGPPGVGKTAVAWRIFSELSGAGVEAAFVDVDQLGMCYPESAEDPGRYRLKERNTAAAAETFRLAGAECVLVSGVVDPREGVSTELFRGTEVTVCRLRTEPSVLRKRIARRGPLDPIEAVLEEARMLDRGDIADLVVETSARSVPEVAAMVRLAAGRWPRLPAKASASSRLELTSIPVAAPGGRVLWVGGAPCVGTSAVGWDLYGTARRAGFTASFIDVDQLGFCGRNWSNRSDADVIKARNLAAVWAASRAAGADVGVVVAHICTERGRAATRAALATTALTLCRLHAQPPTLSQRVDFRVAGRSWYAPGDQVRGASLGRRARLTDQSVACAIELERLGIGDIRVVTDGLSVDETVEAVLDLTEWSATSVARARTDRGHRRASAQPFMDESDASS